jgi:hypothetical protein
MQLLYLIALATAMAASLTTLAYQQKYDRPAEVTQAVAQVNQYRMFMYVAAQYMKGYAGGAATIPWSSLKTVATAPSGAVNAGMPVNWKVVAASDNSWVACTPMDERALGMVQQLAVQGGLSLNSTQITGANYTVVGAATDIGKAASCS